MGNGSDVIPAVTFEELDVRPMPEALDGLEIQRLVSFHRENALKMVGGPNRGFSAVGSRLNERGDSKGLAQPENKFSWSSKAYITHFVYSMIGLSRKSSD